jgi:hypothetical protein
MLVMPEVVAVLVVIARQQELQAAAQVLSRP